MIFFKDYIQKGEPFENLLFTDGSGIPMSTNKYEWFTQERELSQLILVDLKFSRFTAKRIRALALSYMSCTAFTALVVHRQNLSIPKYVKNVTNNEPSNHHIPLAVICCRTPFQKVFSDCC